MGTAYIGTNAPDIESYDTTSYALIHSVSTGTAVVSLALSPDLTTLYSVENNGTVSSFTASTLALIHTTLLPGTGNLFETIITSGDGLLLYATDRANSLVYVLTASTFATVTTISVSNDPFGLAVTPTDTLLYVAQQTANQVTAYNIPAYTVHATIAVGSTPTNLSMSIDGLTLYAGNFTVPSISVISTASNTVSATIPLGTGTLVLDLQVTPNDTYLYAVDGFSAVAWQITTASNTVTDTITTGSFAQHLAPMTDSSQMWFTEFTGSANQVENYAVPADTLIHTIPFGGTAPGPIVITPRSGFHPTPPVTLVIPELFVPRKGFTDDYDESDYMIDWLAIERWANSWAPVLFIPCKPQLRTPTVQELQANWLQIEIWADTTAQAAMVAGGSAKWVSLFIPRKDSDRTDDLNIDFLAIQNWGNGLR